MNPDFAEHFARILQPVERRQHPRYPFRETLIVTPLRNGERGQWRNVTGSDISLGGISFILDFPPDCEEVAISFTLDGRKFDVLAQVMGHRALSGVDGRLVRCRFRTVS